MLFHTFSYNCGGTCRLSQISNLTVYSKTLISACFDMQKLYIQTLHPEFFMTFSEDLAEYAEVPDIRVRTFPG